MQGRTPPLEPEILALYSAQASVGVSVGIVLLLLGRARGHRYLVLWGLAFAAMGLFHGFAGITLSLGSSGALGPSRTVVSALSLACGYLFVVWFAAGTLLAAGRPGLEPAAVRLFALLALAAGVLAAVAFQNAPFPSPERLVVRVGLRTLVTGAVLLPLGIFLFRRSAALGIGGLGPYAFPVTTLLFALLHLDYALSTVVPVGLTPRVGGVWIRLLELALFTTLGMSAVAWLASQEAIRGDRAAQDHRQTTQVLEEEREWAHFLYRNVLDVIAEVDRDGVILRASPAVEQVLGVEEGEAAGVNAFDLLHPADHSTARRALKAEAGEVELRVRGPGGSWRWIELVGRSPGGRSGETVVITARDVTERRELSARLLRSQRLEITGRLVGSVTHDFNNVLAVIRANGEVLRAELPLAASGLREEVEAILAAAEVGGRLARRLLAFARTTPSAPVRVDLNGVVEELADVFLPRLLGEGVTLVRDLSTGPLPVVADPSELESVVLNLAVNARDAMPDGGTLTLRTFLKESGIGPAGPSPAAVLEVQDTGPGIPRDLQQRIFEPFFTTREARGGTGLGLATVRSIVQASGGWVEVDSAPGEGATFRVHLPLSGSDAAP